MKAGRELDALVAEKVMGWRRMSWKDYHAHMSFMGTDEREEFTYAWHDADGNLTEHHASDVLYYDNPTPAWSPSEEIADAWLVVEKWEEFVVKKTFVGKYRAKIANKSNPKWCMASANTAQLAICLAALKAVEAT